MSENEDWVIYKTTSACPLFGVSLVFDQGQHWTGAQRPPSWWLDPEHSICVTAQHHQCEAVGEMAWCSSVSKSPSYMVQVGPGILKLKGDYPNSSVHVVTWIEIYFRVQEKGLFPSNFWENPEGEPHPCLQSSHDLCTSMASSVCPTPHHPHGGALPMKPPL